MVDTSEGGVCVKPTFEDLLTPAHPAQNRDLSSCWILTIFFISLVYALRLCMGNSASNIYKKTSSYFCSPSDTSTDHFADSERNIIVLRERRSSLSRDEDNDVAHEFYEETKYKDGKTRMKQVLKTYPLGFVKLAVPCLHPDFTRVIIPNYDIISQLHRQTKQPR